VAAVVGMVADGMSEPEVVAAYPDLEAEDVREAIRYAAEAVRERELPVSRPAVSQHLKVLKDARLVVDRPAGNRRIYQLDPEGVGALRADLEQFWSKALATYKAVVEERTEEVS